MTDLSQQNIQDNHNLIMRQMGNILASEKDTFVDLLEANEIPVDDMEDTKLVDVYIENLPDNDSLKTCTAYLLNEKVNGDKVDNKGISDIFDVIYNYWTEPKSNWVGDVIKGATDIGGKIIDAEQQKKYGASMALNKQAEARSEMLKTLQAQKQAQLEAQKALAERQKAESEAKSKRKTTIIIASSVILGLATIGTIIYFIRKNK